MTLRGTRRRLRSVVTGIGLERAAVELDLAPHELAALTQYEAQPHELVARAHKKLHDAIVDGRLAHVGGAWRAVPGPIIVWAPRPWPSYLAFARASCAARLRA